MLALARRLRSLGVLGINARNARYVLRYNARRLYPIVDDKLLTKERAIAGGVKVPELYGTVEYQHQTQRLDELLAAHEEFVVKPASGSGGDGILVVGGRRQGLYVKVSGETLDSRELEFHVSKILSGLFSLGGERDRAMIEYRVRFDPLFEEVSYRGVPDIRIIVFLGYPVMAMVRLPTHASDGKANLHQGAIGVGIDLARGVTLRGVRGSAVIAEHPDTGVAITGLSIPHWQQMLEIAAGCWQLAGLGYLGVDLVLDRDLGPLLLELNARPGLAIQIANRRGLRSRLELVEKAADPEAGVAERVAFSRHHFREPVPA